MTNNDGNDNADESDTVVCMYVDHIQPFYIDDTWQSTGTVIKFFAKSLEVAQGHSKWHSWEAC